MKNILGAFLLLLSQTAVFAQASTELVISGISPEVEKSFFPGEIMAYHTFDDGNPVKNIKVVVTTEKRR